MCKECQKIICPPACPSFNSRLACEGSPIYRCFFCGNDIYEDDEFLILGHVCLCKECAKDKELTGEKSNGKQTFKA